MSIEQMKEKISLVYDNFTWRNKVQNMPDKQVIAIYFKFLNDGKFKRINKQKTNKYKQMTVFDYI